MSSIPPRHRWRLRTRTQDAIFVFTRADDHVAIDMLLQINFD